MEIKKFNPDELEAPLVGGAVDRNVVNSQEPDDLTEDGEVNNEDELADENEDELNDDKIESEDGEDDTDEEDELTEFDEKEEDSAEGYEDVDENAFDKN